MMQLQKADYKILEALLTNSRATLTSLGKAVHLSRESTAYRLARLRRINLIKSFNAFINVESLGFKQYALFLQLVRLTKEKELEILNYLKTHKSISWIGILAGKWSLTLDIYAKDDLELTGYLRSILHLFSSCVSEYAILPLESKEYYLHKVFGGKTHDISKTKKYVMHKFDKTDMQILKLLNANSQISYAELSKDLKLTANAIKKRIKQLEAKGIIQGYSIAIDPKLLGFEWYGLQLKLLTFDEKSIKELIRFFREHPNVVFYYRYLSGAWDFDVGILVKNSNDLRVFVNELRSKFTETVKLNDFFLLLEEITNYALPEILWKR